MDYRRSSGAASGSMVRNRLQRTCVDGRESEQQLGKRGDTVSASRRPHTEPCEHSQGLRRTRKQHARERGEGAQRGYTSEA